MFTGLKPHVDKTLWMIFISGGLEKLILNQWDCLRQHDAGIKWPEDKKKEKVSVKSPDSGSKIVGCAKAKKT